MKLLASQLLAFRQALDGQQVADWVASDEHPGLIHLTHQKGVWDKYGWAANVYADYGISATPDWDGDGELAVYLTRQDGDDVSDLGDCYPDPAITWTGNLAQDIELWRERVAEYIRCVEPLIFASGPGGRARGRIFKVFNPAKVKRRLMR